ncbi:hypothetical protein [Pseudanabaena sp. 'Roaring Creek']|uniref:hypothetical protein n=1 Tax=Pseudanabaena sp. 'Roaring Creek' TaxID=1681830 RepID=UPI0006D7D52A|nr:hypothetical protein [Pseudanabaena sp. 'Roaring Creek']
MYEFWLKEKLLLIVGLFQFGLILIVFAIAKLSKLVASKLSAIKESNQNKIKFASIPPSSSDEEEVVSSPINHEADLETTPQPIADESINPQPEINNDRDDQENIEPPVPDLAAAELTYKVEIAPDLLTELKEISSDPTAIIDEAIRWWLRRRTLEVLDASPDRQYRVGLNTYGSGRSTKDRWND